MKHIILLAVLCLAGCFGGRIDTQEQGSKSPIGLGADLIALGGHLVFWGGLVFAAALVIRLVLAIGSFGKFLAWIPGYGTALGLVATLGELPGLTGIVGLALSCGGASFIVGEVFCYLGTYIVLVVLACIATGLAVAWFHHADLRRWLDRRSTARATDMTL